MPALKILGVRTPAAGDDLGPACFLTVCLRLVQFGCGLYVMIFFAQRERSRRNGQGADPGFLLTASERCYPDPNRDDEAPIDLYQYFVPLTIAFSATTVFACLVALPTELWIWSVSRRGSPVEVDKRTELKPLCNFRFAVLGTIQLCSFAVGVAAATQARNYCLCVLGAAEDTGRAVFIFDYDHKLCRLDSSWHTCFQVVVWSQFVEGCVVAFFLFRAGWKAFRKRTHRVLERSVGVTRETEWKFCCRLCCSCSALVTCCLFGGWETDTGGFADISRALGNYFDDRSTLDVTLSDIVAGIIMVWRAQRERVEELSERLLNEAAKAEAEAKANANEGEGAIPPATLSADSKRFRVLFDGERSSQSEGSHEGDEALSSSEPPKVVTAESDGKGEKETVTDHVEEGERDSVEEEGSCDEEKALGDGRVPPANEAIEDESPPRHGDEVPSSEDSFATAVTSDSKLFRQMSLIAARSQLNKRPAAASIAAAAASQRLSLTYRLNRVGSVRFEASAAIRTVLGADNDADLKAISEGARYCRQALGIYSWKLYQYHHPCTGVCTLSCLRCADALRNPCLRPAAQGRQIIGDAPLLRFNETAVAHVSRLGPSQVVYAQFKGGFAATPYFVGIDPPWKTVTVVLRGTLSLDDVMTDATLDPVSLEEWGERCGFDGKGEFAHGGVLACAGWVYEDLEEYGVLDRLLLGDSPKCPGYRLRIVGHSLGAGTAAVLGLMLRSKHPTLRCLSYEPPGCVFSEGLARSCAEYVTSFVHNDDVVPRLSLRSMEHLRDDVLDTIARIKVPKREVMEAHVWGAPGCNGDGGEGEDGDGDGDGDGDKGPRSGGRKRRRKRVDRSNSCLLHRQESAPRSDFLERLEEFRAAQTAQKAETGVSDVRMLPPGKIIHMVKTRDEPSRAFDWLRRRFVGKEELRRHPYDARWAEAEDFGEILVSNSMMLDHDPLNVCLAIEGIASSMGLEEPYLLREK